MTAPVGIVGRGRVGSDLVRLMDLHGLPCIAVDLDDGLAPLDDVDVIVEAITEDLADKRSVVAALVAADPHRVVLTTTSSFTAAEVATPPGASDPSPRVAAWHPFRPMHRRRLIELAAHPSTDADVLERARALAHALDLTCLEVPDRTGFVVNRVLKRWTHAALDAAGDQTAEEVDDVFTADGFPLGPFAVVSLVGPVTSLRIARRFESVYGPRFRPPARLAAAASNAPPRTGAPLPTRDVLSEARLATADEIGRLVAAGCAADTVATGLVLGAGWPRELVDAWVGDAIRA